MRTDAPPQAGPPTKHFGGGAGRSPLLAAVLSLLVPGLGQLYAGDRAKGIALLCITAGVWGGIAMSTVGPAALRSWLTALFLGFAYLFVWIPAALDAHQHAAGRPSRLLSDGRSWYVILMLLAVGPMALPLLWQSRAFSRTGKLVWTIVVIAIALLIVLSLIVLGPILERSLETYPELRQMLQDGGAF